MTKHHRRRSVLSSIAAIPVASTIMSPFTHTPTESAGLTFEILDVDRPYAGEQAQIQFRMSNPSEKPRTERIALDADGRREIHSDVYTVPPNSTKTETVTWHLRNDSAGHTVLLNLSGAEDNVNQPVSVHSSIRLGLVSVDRRSARSGAVVVEYTAENTGGAPTTQELTLNRDGEPVHTQTISLNIGELERYQQEIPISESEFELSIRVGAVVLHKTVLLDDVE